MSKQKTEFDEALLAAIRLLSGRNYSIKELKTKLKTKSFSEEAIERAVQLVIDKGYINESSYCRSLFRKYAKSRKYGLKFIVQKLKMQHGFSEDIIQAAIADFDASCEVEWAIQAVEKKFGAEGAGSEPAKAARYLAGKGFSSTVIAKALRE